MRKYNKYVICGDFVQAWTTKGEQFFLDLKDSPAIKSHTWCVGKTGYLVSNINGKTIKLHRFLLGCKPHEVIDHIDGDKLNNRRSNLRKCTPKENAANCPLKKNNTSGYPGVQLLPCGKYRARIMVNRKEIALGRYLSLKDAIAARQKAEQKYFKNFAPHKGALKDIGPFPLM